VVLLHGVVCGTDVAGRFGVPGMRRVKKSAMMSAAGGPKLLFHHDVPSSAQTRSWPFIPGAPPPWPKYGDGPSPISKP
jgi:hypothetical protein